MLRAALSLFAFIAFLSFAEAQTATIGEGTSILPTATEDDYAHVVKRAVEGFIIPAYGRLQEATAELGPALGDLCLFPDPYQRRFVAQTFASTVEAWAGVDFLRFGPMTRENRYDRFAYFPDVHGTGARQLRRFLASEDENLLKPGALAGQSAAVQGLPALEALLYSGSKALVEAEETEAYRCALAERIAGNLNSIAKEVLAEWRAADGWAALIRAPGASNPVYRTYAEAVTEILKAMLTGLEQVRDHRLMPALGKIPEDAKASRAPYNSSGQALVYLLASADALQRFADASGILGLVPEEQKWIAGSVAFEFANLQRALEGAGPDLEAALADPERRAKLAYAAIVLRSLRDLFQVRLAQAAGITAGFNSLDGD